jgi:fructokinase
MNDTGLVIFGEVLFDHFPDGKRVLGGAPFNVAWHLQAFGQAPVFISRVGDDIEGSAVRTAMQDWGMSTDGLQTDSELPTGRVEVRIVEGEPHYEILHPAAFDAIAAPAIGEGVAPNIHLLYHGSLALRSATASQALDTIRALQPDTVLVDVNLRSPWWQRQTVLKMADLANWVKLNHHELDWLCPSDVGGHGQVSNFITDHQLDGVLLTHGEKGAELFTSGGPVDRIKPDHTIKPVDTVGAGDAFTSVFILGLACGWPGSLTLSRAQAFASAVCSFRGATTQDSAFYRPFIHDWLIEK